MKISYEAFSAIEEFVYEQNELEDGDTSDEMLFEVLDVAFDGLVPEQDVVAWGGVYTWVCDYAGGRFYAPVEEVGIFALDGI